jgi:hypothetical protein
MTNLQRLSLATLVVAISSPLLARAGCSGWYKVGIATGFYVQKHGVQYSPNVAAKLCREDEACQEQLRLYCPE